MYTTILKQPRKYWRVIANEPTKEIKWNCKKYFKITRTTKTSCLSLWPNSMFPSSLKHASTSQNYQTSDKVDFRTKKILHGIKKTIE